MKKLTTLFVLIFLAIGLFAEQVEIPKNINNSEKEPFVYINDSITNMYTVSAFVNNDFYGLEFTNVSLTSDIFISLKIVFENEKKLDDFISKNFTSKMSYDLPNTFTTIRNKIIDISSKKEYSINKDENKLEGVTYSCKWK